MDVDAPQAIEKTEKIPTEIRISSLHPRMSLSLAYMMRNPFSAVSVTVAGFRYLYLLHDGTAHQYTLTCMT